MVNLRDRFASSEDPKELNNGAANSWRVIDFTSSLPQEGKSTIAASLALLMAQAEHELSRSIVIFAIHHCHVNLPQTLTIEFNFERGGMDQSTRLTFLPAATNNRLIHSNDILSVDTTRKLFENLQSRYDYVLVDLTPLMPIVDTRATRAFVDCYVCVIEWGRTTSNAVKHAFRDAHNISENMLEIVLNWSLLRSRCRGEAIGIVIAAAL